MSFKLECSRKFSRMFGKLCCSPNKKRHHEYDSNEEVMLSEMIEEKEKLCSIVNPLLRAPPLEHVEDGTQQLVLDRAAKEKAELPPILMRSLRKVYPSSGRSPPKVALNSLDLHVPKGQVLGLLGKTEVERAHALIFFRQHTNPRTESLSLLVMILALKVLASSKSLGAVHSSTLSGQIFP